MFIAPAVLWFPDPSQGLVRRHDVADAELLRNARAFPAVGRVGTLGDGALIAPRWVLTAGHVARFVRDADAFHLDTPQGVVKATIQEIFVHPDFTGPGAGDIALLLLAEDVDGVTPLELLADDAALTVGTECILVGHGAFGRGDDSERSEDRRRRAGTNRVHELEADTVIFRFERPDEGATELEVIPGPGDSGGPALVRVGDSFQVAAVSSGGLPGFAGPGTYEARDVFARLSTARGWITKVLTGEVPATPPAPQSSEPAPPARETAAGHPAGTALLALLEVLRDPDTPVDTFVADHFAPSNSPDALGRRTRALIALRQRYGGMQLVEILQTTPRQIDGLLRGNGRDDAILGVQVDGRGRITAIFDGSP